MVRIYAIGHSTRTQEEFGSLLAKHGIKILCDIRRFPQSARHPQFNRDNMQIWLAQMGVGYVWFGDRLGGYRKAGLGDNSPNKGWRSLGFRSYADYTFTEQFKRAAQDLVEMASRSNLCYMCAERHYWRCHRRILSDYLVAKGHEVLDIVDESQTIRHALPSFAVVRDGALTYPQAINDAGQPAKA